MELGKRRRGSKGYIINGGGGGEDGIGIGNRRRMKVDRNGMHGRCIGGREKEM